MSAVLVLLNATANRSPALNPTECEESLHVVAGLLIVQVTVVRTLFLTIETTTVLPATGVVATIAFRPVKVPAVGIAWFATASVWAAVVK